MWGGEDDSRGGPALVGGGGSGGDGKAAVASPAARRPGETALAAPPARETAAPAVSGTPKKKTPAGGTVITELDRCTVPRREAATAYQSAGRVFTGQQGDYELSPNAHVYPDRVIWKPDLV